jgi:7,8-dihydro-6-hydroxymethylpterin dimethyltransferase
MQYDRTETESLCPVCLRKIPAKIAMRDNTAVLEKTCPSHGRFETPIWRGEPSFESWTRPKIPKSPPVAFTGMEKGCPYDCGLCPDHRQRSCTILIEVTERCDLNCPVCYADSGNGTKPDPSVDEIRSLFRAAWKAAENSNIQLSGGEPATRDDLPEIVAVGRESGFSFVQLNTNGLRIARDAGFVRALKDAGLSSVFLQFDGVDDEVYRKLRGRKLLKEKLDAIAACEKNGIGVVLVPTIVPGINDGSIGDILKKAVELTPTARSVHFQPVSYFGRYFVDGPEKRRTTLPEIMRAMENQTDGMFKADQFKPPGCENAMCSFHANFLVEPGGKVVPLQNADKSCCGPINAEEGAARAISYVARQWAAPAAKDIVAISETIAEKKSGKDRACGENRPVMSLDDFIARARTHTFSVSAMAFQDAWNVDLNRVRDCCIHVVSPDRRLVPFCLYNLTSANGERLYRP